MRTNSCKAEPFSAFKGQRGCPLSEMSKVAGRDFNNLLSRYWIIVRCVGDNKVGGCVCVC